MGRINSLLVFLVVCNVVFSFDITEQANPYYISSIQYLTNGITAVATFNFDLPKTNETVIINLWLNITYDNASRLRIRITDLNNPRWEIPYDLEPYTISGNSSLYSVEVNEFPMGINVVRTSDQKVIFNLDPQILFRYDDQDIYFSNSLNYNISVLGLGERICPFVIPQGIYTLWSRDRTSPYDNGQSQVGNMYSVHPFYMVIDKESGSAFGGLFYNSNGMQANVSNSSLSFRTSGGIIDLWLFIGPTPRDVVSQYHQLIGYPTLLPYWSLGWHQSRYGYSNISVVQDVLNKYMSLNIPLDAMWSDIDYMNLYQDFVLNQTSYPTANVSRFIQTLQLLNKHYIPIVDAGISQNNSYNTYSQGLNQNVFIQSPYNITYPPTPTVGVVWPGNATFVDWLNPNATSYWINQLRNFQNTVAFSGIWIDMNEVRNYINGEVGHPPSIITNLTMPFVFGEDINTRSLDAAAIHYGGILEYNFHSLYGYYETKAANIFFTNVLNIRPFILSRSSFPGHGRYGSKWLGDNWSQWEFMQYSITGIFNFGMFGIPMIGADICGFLGNTTPELCLRWTQLGTLYPFSRNHNDISSIPQEPWVFGPTVLSTSIASIRNKYMLYLYFYTQMTLLSVGGGMFFEPTYFAYPNETNFLNNSTNSFMLGKGLIVHPCLWPGIIGANSLFPNDTWYNLYTGQQLILDANNMAYLNMPLQGLINIHLSLGHIIPIIDSYTTALDSSDTRKSNISLIIAHSINVEALGTIIFDDGLSPDTIDAVNYTQIEYVFYSYNSTWDILALNILALGYKRQVGEWPYISTIILYGCYSPPTKVYKYNRKGTTLLNVQIIWDPLVFVCKILLTNNLQPDEFATLFIDYSN